MNHELQQQLNRANNRIDRLESLITKLSNNPAPTLPIYDPAHFPQDAVEGQLVLTIDDSAYQFTNGAWHSIGGAADWVYIGTAGAPAFQNSWTNMGGTQVPMRYRYLPYKDFATSEVGIEIEGSVTGGVSGTTIFTLPITLDYDLHLSASDGTGGFLVLTIKQSGDVVYGFV